MAIKLNYQIDEHRRNGQVKECILSSFKVLINSVSDNFGYLRKE